jgi:hypothetical protein
LVPRAVKLSSSPDIYLPFRTVEINYQVRAQATLDEANRVPAAATLNANQAGPSLR